LLQALLPWVTGSFSEEEKEAMMGSLREATKNTMFDQWLGAVQQSGAAAAAAASAGTAVEDQPLGPTAAAAGSGAAAAPEQQQQQQQMPMSDLAEIAEYLAGSGSLPQVLQQQQQVPLGSVPPALHQQQCLTEVSGTVAESTNYVPGWEDIFNINQKQLEAAIRRVSNDPNLEPQRKAYLIQNIMVSRYIVAQQRRMQTGGGSAGAAAAAAATAGAAAAGQMLPPAVQHQHVQHQYAHAHGNMAGGCCHHDAHADRQQQQQQHHHVQVQPSSSSAVTAPQQQQQQQQQPVRTYADTAAGVLGCKHYRRSAQLVAPCCDKVFTCRWVGSLEYMH
jgi:zinc finger-like protein